ncbi:MAG TPA: LytTR family DNA-binding domain-containing protein [Puia sp.]|nr:LytTR family DNA-binding domain-containing protein [Puia sp.]
MTDSTPIRCIIVDDEPLAVALLADYVQKTPGLEVVLRTTHVLEALQAVQEGRADLLFLDIQMPELTGIQFMKIIRRRCKVILTTAYTQYALEGYEHDVADYLLKPITLDRFMIAVEKAKERLGRGQGNIQGSAPRVPDPPDHLFIRTEYRIQRVDLSSIHYIEALRDYVAIHTDAGKILSLESMKHMEELLPEDQFIRIHKSYIIHRNKIDFLERGRVVIGKEYLPIGDTYKEKVRLKLGLL